MRENIELLSSGLMGSLIKNNNTIVSVKHYNETLASIYNEKHPKNKIKPELLCNARYGSIYEILSEEFKMRLENKLNKRIVITLLPADSPSTVDCMKIQTIGVK